MRFTLIAVLALIALILPARADLIQLKNGAVFEGKIINETDEVVTLRLHDNRDADSSIDMQFKRNRIKTVTLSENLLDDDNESRVVNVTRKKEPENSPQTAQDEDEAVAPDLFGQEGKDKDGGKESDGETYTSTTNPLIVRYIEDLASVDGEIRSEAHQKLIAFGKEATPPLVETLQKSDNFTQRRSIVRALADIRDKRATRVLIEQLKGTERESSLMEWAWIALKNTTEQSYPFTSTASDATRKEQYEGWLGWWQTVSRSDSYANQLGASGSTQEKPTQNNPDNKKTEEPETGTPDPAEDDVDW